MSEKFRVGITRDALDDHGKLVIEDIGLGLLDAAPNVEWEFMPEYTGTLTAGQVRDYDALVVLGARVTADTFEDGDRPLLVARFGVGYDTSQCVLPAGSN